MPAVLLTRPAQPAAISQKKLEAMGWAVLLNPLFSLDTLDYTLPDKPYQAALLTSGLAAFALRQHPYLPVYAVGDASATEAKAAGSTTVYSATGDAAALFELVKAKLKPEAGPLLYLAGQERAFDMVGQAQQAGFAIDLVEVYGMSSTGALLPAIANALHDKTVAAILLYSPYAAKRLRALLDEAKIDVGQQVLVCLSPKVAEAAGTGWQAVHVAHAPNEDSLFEKLNTITQGCYTSIMTTEAEQTTPALPLAETTPEVGTEAKCKPAAKGGRLALAVSLLALVVGISSPVVFHTVVGDLPISSRVEETEVPAKLAALAEKIEILNKKQGELMGEITALRNAPPQAAPVSDTQSTALANQVEYLSKKLDELANRPAAKADDGVVKAQLAVLATQIETLQTKLAAQADPRLLQAERVRFLAMLQLNTALQSGEAFRAPWVMLQSTPAGAMLNDYAAALEPYSNKGVPTLATLLADYAAAARATLAATKPAATSWWDSAVNQTKGLVSIRRQGEVEGDEPEAILARAEVRLQNGKLQSAIDELNKLPAEAQAALGEWLPRAKARASADALIAHIQEETARNVAATPEGAAP